MSISPGNSVTEKQSDIDKQSNHQVPTGHRVLALLGIVIAGEMIFSLPFHLPRFFRPSFLESFQLSNTQLGDIFAVYGVLAMLAYFPGGALADRFSARRLMVLSLIATSLGGFFLLRMPGVNGLVMVYAYWGVTSVLLFWAAMLRATREWGGATSQGKAFGILDGGRGLAAAVMASVAVALFAHMLPEQLSTVSQSDRIHALQWVILFYSIVTLLAAGLIWCLIPDSPPQLVHTARDSLRGMGLVLRQRVVWLQAIIVVCAYCGFKGLDNYALFATQILKMNEVEAAGFTANAAYLRPVGAIAAGLLADRFLGSRMIAVSFGVLCFSYLGVVFYRGDMTASGLIVANLLLSFFAVFAIRGIYFAMLEETRVSRGLTGTAIGLISVVGFTPDIFFASITGRILDAGEGFVVWQRYFFLLSLIAFFGLIAAITLTILNQKKNIKMN